MGFVARCRSRERRPPFRHNNAGQPLCGTRTSRNPNLAGSTPMPARARWVCRNCMTTSPSCKSRSARVESLRSPARKGHRGDGGTFLPDHRERGAGVPGPLRMDASGRSRSTRLRSLADTLAVVGDAPAGSQAACEPPMLMRRGFSASGTTRFRTTCNRPFCRSAPSTTMWSASANRRSNARPAMPRYSSSPAAYRPSACRTTMSWLSRTVIVQVVLPEAGDGHGQAVGRSRRSWRCCRAG